MSIEPFSLSIESSLERLFKIDTNFAEIIGTNSPAAIAAIANGKAVQNSPKPTLFLFSKEDEEAKFLEDLNFFDAQVPVYSLPKFDVSPYSGLYPNRNRVGERLFWLFQAQNAKPGTIFSASVEALCQRTLPHEVFLDNSFSISVGDSWGGELTEKLETIGYAPASLVESYGHYAIRGGIVDIFPTSSKLPVRLELFGDEIESIRFFDPETQRSTQNVNSIEIPPAREVLYLEDRVEKLVNLLNEDWSSREVSERDKSETLIQIQQRNYFHGLEYLLPFSYESPSYPLDYFLEGFQLAIVENSECKRVSDEFHAEFKFGFEDCKENPILPKPEDFYINFDRLVSGEISKLMNIEKVKIHDLQDRSADDTIELKTSELTDFIAKSRSLNSSTDEFNKFLKQRFTDWKEAHEALFFLTSSASQAQRVQALFERIGFLGEIIPDGDRSWSQWKEEQARDSHKIHIIPKTLSHSLRFQAENITFILDEDIFGKKAHKKSTPQHKEFQKASSSLVFSDLKEGDYVVHKLHGVGIFGGLKVMQIQGVDAEFLQVDYKDKDRLYLPIYRVGQIQRYSGPQNPSALDKLGGNQWEKTKTKVKSHLRDLAADLLKIYSERSQLSRPPFSEPDQDYQNFEAQFPYTETKDQEATITAVIEDMCGEKPMDRLICGDVGFGKTEVAMRAAFKAAQDGKQVAIVAPTTVLAFQHFETFKKRFKHWPLEIRALNRFVAKSHINKTVADLKDGKVDIVIGTHRVLSKDVHFKNLGLLIIDEEQKFGVRHKERLRKFKTDVDTLAMSATPIPRTLNMSLMGIRDLSIINTAPTDRLPTRTFITKFDPESIRRSVLSEVARGGQVFFIHNRVQSIYALADELRAILPDVRLAVGHGQMDEAELEKIMVSFFKHEIDVLVCTTIVESGVDNPRANTMFIDNAHQFGLSQLYQLRGRVGRSSERAYCYLLVPRNIRLEKEAQERLKVLQENSTLGSGFKIAHYDLELRGSGDLLGESQSGHINAVGYELYMELMEEALAEAKGEDQPHQDLEPEINLRFPALIPDKYIPDIKVRLGIYKSLSEIDDENEIEDIEDQLNDQFGRPPEEVNNLLGVMLIRKLCKDLSIRDLSSGPKTISLTFTDATPLPADKVIELASRPNKKYTVTPDQRLNVRMNDITWPKIYDELKFLCGLARI